MSRRNWSRILGRAVDIVESYDTGVTLRQLFYRLVSEEWIPNTRSTYVQLSMNSAKARRAGEFPALVDNTREIWRPAYSTDMHAAMIEAAKDFRLDRTDGQDWTIYAAIEKHALEGLLKHWFGKLGIHVVALGGYASQTLYDDMIERLERDDRPAVAIYAGDFDPTGTDIDRDMEQRTNGLFSEFRRIALSWEQVLQHDLPPQPGKAQDPRARSFYEKHGRLVQVELDALPPDVLKQLYQDAINDYWDSDPFDEVKEKEKAQRRVLFDLSTLALSVETAVRTGSEDSDA